MTDNMGQQKVSLSHLNNGNCDFLDTGKDHSYNLRIYVENSITSNWAYSELLLTENEA